MLSCPETYHSAYWVLAGHEALLLACRAESKGSGNFVDAFNGEFLTSGLIWRLVAAGEIIVEYTNEWITVIVAANIY